MWKNNLVLTQRTKRREVKGTYPKVTWLFSEWQRMAYKSSSSYAKPRACTPAPCRQALWPRNTSVVPPHLCSQSRPCWNPNPKAGLSSATLRDDETTRPKTNSLACQLPSTCVDAGDPRRERNGSQESVSQRGRVWPLGEGQMQNQVVSAVCLHILVLCCGVTHVCFVLSRCWVGWCTAGSGGCCSLPSPWCITCVMWRPSLEHFPRETPGLVLVTQIYPVASLQVWLAHKHHPQLPIRKPRAPFPGRPSCRPLC